MNFDTKKIIDFLKNAKISGFLVQVLVISIYWLLFLKKNNINKITDKKIENEIL